MIVGYFLIEYQIWVAKKSIKGADYHNKNLYQRKYIHIRNQFFGSHELSISDVCSYKFKEGGDCGYKKS